MVSKYPHPGPLCKNRRGIIQQSNPGGINGENQGADVVNRSGYIKRQLLSEVIRLIYKDRLIEEIDAIPVKLFPKDQSSYRCCVYKDRAMVRQRILAILGFTHIEDDETLPLANFALRALERKAIAEETMTLMPELCSGCEGGIYRVTDLCRRCVARSCSQVCPRNAIHFHGYRAEINQDLCIGCGKCADACAYHAVGYQPVPCEEGCPVDAIVRDEWGNRSIDNDHCIRCGRCVTRCPFGAPLDVSQVVDMVYAMRKGKKTALMLAPAVLSQYPGDPAKLRGALLNAGFAGVYDVGQGAAAVSEEEAREGLERKAEGKGPLFSSCCPSWMLAVDKQLPQLKDQVSSVPSPMVVSAEKLKEQDPDLNIIFAGPCFAKKEEAMNVDAIDGVITFEELGALLMARNIQLDESPAVRFTPIETLGVARALEWSFARSGGLSDNLSARIEEDVLIEKVAGLDRKQLKKLAMADRFFKDKNFVEVMACGEGCIGGPGCLIGPDKAQKNLEKQIKNFANK